MNSLKYDPKGWVKSYSTEKNNLLFFLSGIKFDIEHFGATSIPYCHSNRNVDILIVAQSIADVSLITARLQTQKYKFLTFLSTPEFSMLVSPKKVEGYGISIRVVLNGSVTHQRLIAFKDYLLDHISHVRHYNDFRETLSAKCGDDWKSYYRIKKSYINEIIDSNFKFE